MEHDQTIRQFRGDSRQQERQRLAIVQLSIRARIIGMIVRGLLSSGEPERVGKLKHHIKYIRLAIVG
jgi:hypothetical protein